MLNPLSSQHFDTLRLCLLLLSKLFGGQSGPLLKCSLKWLMSLNPASFATNMIFSEASLNKRFARSMRISLRNSIGGH